MMSAQELRGFSDSDAPSDAIYNRCVRCGLCLSSCPTYIETLTETSGPRGRISLMKSVGEGNLDILSPGFTYQMSECLGCRACEAVCPSGVHYGQLIETARAQIARVDPGGFWERVARFFAFRVLFASLRRVRILARVMRVYQRSGLQAFARRSGILKLLGLERIEGLMPPISTLFFTPRNQQYAAQSPRATVFMHAGCVMHVAYAHVDEATVRMLQRARFTVVVPAAQGCCGALNVHAGERDSGRALAKRNIETFERSGADFYIVNAAGCGAALKEYGEWFAGDAAWAHRAAAFSANVRDVLELLADVELPPPNRSLEQTVTYQEPCHLAHAQRISAAPRALLDLVPGLRRIEMAESSVCCGSAGIYNLTMPEMSQRLGRRKIENAKATGAQVIATANPGCALQLQAMCRNGASQTRVVHVVELLDEAYR
ncbi:MAG: 4Fe-4S dicluster domain-containing protein [Candidatus Eremiobacteraeota bacterium]|nr:4Fe-4S dicluster domain-containing protein [Candidatus Eremiobacteraeota bacterium]